MRASIASQLAKQVEECAWLFDLSLSMQGSLVSVECPTTTGSSKLDQLLRFPIQKFLAECDVSPSHL
jgi:hypothetical protein